MTLYLLPCVFQDRVHMAVVLGMGYGTVPSECLIKLRLAFLLGADAAFSSSANNAICCSLAVSSI